MTSLNHDFTILSNLFYIASVVLSPHICSFMLFGVKDEHQTDLVSNNITTRNDKEEKVPGITYDNKFDFSTHLTSITKNKYKAQYFYPSTKICNSKKKDLLTIIFYKVSI